MKAMEYLTKSVLGASEDEVDEYYFKSNKNDLIGFLAKTKNGQKAKEIAEKLDKTGKNSVAKDFHVCAANNGVVSEMIYLADSYHDGINGFYKNSKLALKWYEEAGNKGNKNAKAKASELKKEIASATMPSNSHSSSSSTTTKLEGLSQALTKFGNALMDASQQMSGNGVKSSRNNNLSTRKKPNPSVQTRNADRELAPTVNEHGVKTWRHPYNTYGWTDYMEYPDGSMGIFYHDVCNLCNGTTACKTCRGSGICQTCHGQRVTRYTRNSQLLPCRACTKSGKCFICNGNGKCACSKTDNPGIRIVATYLYDPQGNLISGPSEARDYTSTDRNTSTTSSTTLITCRMCNGTGLEQPLKNTVCAMFSDKCYDIDCKACNKRHCHHLNQHKNCVSCGGTGKK